MIVGEREIVGSGENPLGDLGDAGRWLYEEQMLQDHTHLSGKLQHILILEFKMDLDENNLSI